MIIVNQNKCTIVNFNNIQNIRIEPYGTHGKTMKAIQLSVEKQMPIICWSYEHKKQIKQTAKKMNAKWIIPEPILATEVRKKVISNRRGLIVDDLDILLRRILDDNVYYATMEDCDIEKLERNNIK